MGGEKLEMALENFNEVIRIDRIMLPLTTAEDSSGIDSTNLKRPFLTLPMQSESITRIPSTCTTEAAASETWEISKNP
jgi:hypothetical protein